MKTLRDDITEVLLSFSRGEVVSMNGNQIPRILVYKLGVNLSLLTLHSYTKDLRGMPKQDVIELAHAIHKVHERRARESKPQSDDFFSAVQSILSPR